VCTSKGALQIRIGAIERRGRSTASRLVVPIASKRRHGHVSKATFGKITGALARHGIELLAESKDHGAAVPCWRRWLLSQLLAELST